LEEVLAVVAVVLLEAVAEEVAEVNIQIDIKLIRK
jgi:hypothetical protein